MTAVRRAFVAIALPAHVLDHIDAALAGVALESNLRLVRREQWHVTLQFLGAVDDIEAVGGALSAVGGQAPLHCRLEGAGAFPRVRRARVVWIGASAPDGAWEELARSVGVALAPLGFGAEPGPFVAHVSVARLRTPSPVGSLVDALSGALAVAGDCSWVADEVVLFESTLGRGGARYEARARIPLEGA